MDVDGGGSLDLNEIVSGISKLRGDARKADIVAVILLTRHLSTCLSEFQEQTGEVLAAQKEQLASIEKTLRDSSSTRSSKPGLSLARSVMGQTSA